MSKYSEVTRRLSLIDSHGMEFDVSRRRDTAPDFTDYVNIVVWGVDEYGEVGIVGNYNFQLNENMSDHSYCDAAVAQMDHIAGVAKT